MTQPQPQLVPRAAAALILARDSAQGIEVFMMQRTHQAVFLAGAFVFPGGAVDASDRDDAVAAQCVDGGDVPDIDGDGLVYRVAAIRECFEESGLLLAVGEDGAYVELLDADVVDRFALLRLKVATGALTLRELCNTEHLRLSVPELAYFSRWVTPLVAPRRFDTRFFVAVGSLAQVPSHDNSETIDHAWIRPADALARHREGAMTLAFATVSTLTVLATFDDTAALMAHVRALTSIIPVLAWPSAAANGRRMLVADDAAYAEVKKLDPTGQGTASCEILPGMVTRLSERVCRLAAPSPSPLTGAGSNTYLVGEGDEFVVINPGTALDVHLAAILAQTGGRIRSILVTHADAESCQAARMLKEKTGATWFGMPRSPDDSCQPDRVLLDGEGIDVAGCTLRVLHSQEGDVGQLCYLLEEEQLLFTGGQPLPQAAFMNSPLACDVRSYLASLGILNKPDIAFIAPGYGFLYPMPSL